MAENKRGWLGNIIGRGVDAFLPGDVYNNQTGGYQNVAPGIAGLIGQLAATMYAGPAAGGAVRKLATAGIDKYLGGPAKIGDVQRERIGMPQMQAQGQRLAPQLFGPSDLAFGQSQFGPYASGYQMPSAPQSGIPTQQTGYGLTLPDFGPPPQQVASSGSFGGGGGGGLGGSGGGGLGLGNIGKLGTTRRYGAIKRS